MTDSLYDRLKANRPDATESTLKVYASNLRALMKKADKTDLSFLTNKKLVESLLSEMSTPTKRNYLNAIIVYLKNKGQTGGGLKSKKIVDYYGKLRDDLNGKLEEKAKTNSKTEKQEKNWISEEEYNEVYKKFEKRAKEALKKDAKGKRCLGVIQKWVILALYKYLPPIRNDYHNTRVITRSESKKIIEKDRNYLVKGNPMKFLFYDYKTKKAEGEKEVTVPPELAKVLRRWLRCNTSGWLLTPDGQNPMTSNQLTKTLTGIFKSELGKSVGTTMLRHIFLSEKFAPALKEMKEAANIMGHSVSTQQQYIKTD